MDRTNEMQPTNVHTDLENTLTLLGYKLRDKNITVKKNFCSDMRDVPAYIGELNQVWTNIIDNAIYAMPKGGELTVETKCDAKQVTVCIADNGSGIPKEILSRIFDPFFTTKKSWRRNRHRAGYCDENCEAPQRRNKSILRAG